jgi:hypothetical protein
MNIEKLLESYLLLEAQIDVWLKNHPNENTEQARKYFDDLTSPAYSSSTHPSARDLTRLSLQQLETFHKAIEKAKEKNLKSAFIQWLTKQIKEKNLSLDEIEKNYIPSLQQVAKSKLDILNKVNSIEELNQELEKAVPAGSISVASDAELGKITEENGWALYMPHTTEASCELGKTGGRRDTSWCTTRTEGENLFSYYTGDGGKNTILFYVIKKGVSAENNPFAKMSVGLKDGEPVFNTGEMGTTVNASNKGLTEKQFKKALGEELAQKFLGLMKRKAAELGNKHPIKQEIESLNQNPTAYQVKFNSFAKDEQGIELRKKFIKQTLGYENISPEIIRFLVKETGKSFRLSIGKNPNTPIEILQQILDGLEKENKKDKMDSIINSLLSNQKTPTATLNLLLKYKGIDIFSVAGHKNAPPDFLTKQAKDFLKKKSLDDWDELIIRKVAANLKTPKEYLAAIAANRNASSEVLAAIAENPNTPIEVLKTLQSNSYEYISNRAKATLKKLNVAEAILHKVLTKLVYL